MLNSTQTATNHRSATITPFPANNAKSQFLSGHPSLVVTEYSYGAEEEVYGEGEPAEFVYQVTNGAVRTYKILDDGRRQIGAFHPPGDIFGLVSGTSHQLTAEATIATTVRMVKRRAFEAAAKTDVRIANDLWTMTAADLRHAEEHMLLLGRKSTTERVTAFLIEMNRRLAGAGMLALPMCRRDIGDYLGLALETVSRTLSRLHDQGMLSFSGARSATRPSSCQRVRFSRRARQPPGTGLVSF
jgi:CRP/FNR family transcriptional regulator, nitrogen fixation regulation protein